MAQNKADKRFILLAAGARAAHSSSKEWLAGICCSRAPTAPANNYNVSVWSFCSLTAQPGPRVRVEGLRKLRFFCVLLDDELLGAGFGGGGLRQQRAGKAAGRRLLCFHCGRRRRGVQRYRRVEKATCFRAQSAAAPHRRAQHHTPAHAAPPLRHQQRVIRTQVTGAQEAKFWFCFVLFCVGGWWGGPLGPSLEATKPEEHSTLKTKAVLGIFNFQCHFRILAESSHSIPALLSTAKEVRGVPSFFFSSPLSRPAAVVSRVSTRLTNFVSFGGPTPKCRTFLLF